MSVIAEKPKFSADQAVALVLHHYGLQAEADELPSERDQNFRLRCADGTQYVLKIANPNESEALLNAENAALAHLAASGRVPVLIPTLSGADRVQIEQHRLRLISFLNGRPLGTQRYQSDALLEEIGQLVGSVNRDLADFDHPALHRRFDWDLAEAERVVAAALPDLTDQGLTTQIEQVLSGYRAQVKPLHGALPCQIIHNDANDYNLIVDAQRVVGLIDFGDMVHSCRVHDLAIAMAYAALGKADPVAAAQRVAAGFHAVQPLTEPELAAVYSLMCLRLAQSACMAARQQAQRPDDPYLGISQTPLRQALPKLTALHPRLGGYLIRAACGLTPVPQRTAVMRYLRAQADAIAPLTGTRLDDAAVLELDLGVGSPLVSSDSGQNGAEALAERINRRMAEQGAAVALGGYGEARLLYTEPAYRQGKLTDPQRCIHLGIDVSLDPGSKLHAPLDGVVHGFVNASARLDYGPVVVLRHQSDCGVDFYTLYGHLSAASLAPLEIGMAISAGQCFAEVGDAPENGDWWPHVHLQLITDMLDIPVNFDGACLPAQRDAWLSLCPDPEWLLRPRRAAAAAANQHDQPDLLSRRRQCIGASVRLSYGSQPLQIVRGSGAHLYDADGRSYVDAYNNVPHVGHSHPRVVRAVSEQLALLNTNTRYLQEPLLAYAEALCAQLPSELDTCYLVASGSEANELALRLARAASGARDLLVLEAAYHGHTSTLIDISPYKHDGPGGTGSPDWVHVTPLPDLYRGRYRAGVADAGERYAAEVGAVIARLRGQGRPLCGYIAETCPSVGGQLLLPSGYLAEVYRLVREAGGVCIADEVQTGFGRLGTHFWGFAVHQVVPDIVVMGKPIANGYPLAAVVCRRSIAQAFDNGMEFFSTYGGSSAACVAGLATLQTVLDEGLQTHALQIGEHLLGGLRELQQRHALIGDVRGSGLFLGVELVNDQATLAPAADQAAFIARRMRERGVLIGTDGPLHNVLKIRGPMPLARSDADLLLQALDESLGETGPRE